LICALRPLAAPGQISRVARPVRDRGVERIPRLYNSSA